jgi:hypothetical protein
MRKAPTAATRICDVFFRNSNVLQNAYNITVNAYF